MSWIFAVTCCICHLLCPQGGWAPLLFTGAMAVWPALHHCNLKACSSAPMSASLSPHLQGRCSRVWKSRNSRQLIAHRLTLGQWGTEMWFTISLPSPGTQLSEGTLYPDCSASTVLSLFCPFFPWFLLSPCKALYFPKWVIYTQPFDLGSAPWSIQLLSLPFLELFGLGLSLWKWVVEEPIRFLFPVNPRPYRLLS